MSPNDGAIDAVVPAFNEASTVRAVVDVLVRSGLFGEVIAVDDGSTDGTLASLRGSGATILSMPENVGKLAAMLAGVDRSRADAVAFFDADEETLTPAHAATLVDAFRSGDYAQACGVVDQGLMNRSRIATGQRVVRRDVLLDLPCDCAGYTAETAINFLADRSGAPTVTVLLQGLRLKHKVDKFGIVSGTLRNAKMVGQMALAHVALRRTGGDSCSVASDGSPVCPVPMRPRVVEEGVRRSVGGLSDAVRHGVARLLQRPQRAGDARDVVPGAIATASNGTHDGTSEASRGFAEKVLDLSDHTLSFVNYFPDATYFGVHSAGLCGGMAYTVLDLFHAGRRAPRDSRVPRVDEPIGAYVKARQVDTLLGRHAARFLALIVNPDDASLASLSDQAFGEVRVAVDRGVPVPVGLVPTPWSLDPARVTRAHQVVARGYRVAEDGARSLDVWDPNRPTDAHTWIVRRPGSLHWREDADDATWRGFFVEDGYRPKVPPIFPGEPEDDHVDPPETHLPSAIVPTAKDVVPGDVSGRDLLPSDVSLRGVPSCGVASCGVALAEVDVVPWGPTSRRSSR